MITAARLRIAGLPVIMAAALCGGCVSSAPKMATGKLPPPLSPDRKAEVVAMFEGQRDEAQLQAALNRWKEGNVAACERALASLVGQRPKFVEARIQYAELLLSQNNPTAAEDQLREALKLAPDRADIYHSLAMAVEASGNTAAAAEFFQKAAQLEPENSLYQMAMEGL